MGVFMRHPFVLLCILVFISVGCVTSSEESIQTSYVIPTLEKVSQNEDSIKKGNVRITLEPAQYQAKKSPIFRVYENDFEKFGIKFSTGNGKREYKIVETPRYVPDPSNLVFNVKVKNDMKRILRLEGTVITLESDKSILLNDQEGYRDFLSGIVLPNEEKEFKIQGPSASLLKEGENISLSLYDVVTSTDQAGNIQKKDYFRWVYKVSLKQESRKDTVKTYGKMMTPWEYQQMYQKQIAH